MPVMKLLLAYGLDRILPVIFEVTTISFPHKYLFSQIEIHLKQKYHKEFEFKVSLKDDHLILKYTLT